MGCNYVSVGGLRAPKCAGEMRRDRRGCRRSERVSPQLGPVLVTASRLGFAAMRRSAEASLLTLL